jgi:phosphoribosylamine--glycine ligase
MKILVIDQDLVGLPFSMNAQRHGHDVLLWQAPEKGKPTLIGDGIVTKVRDWKTKLSWADMIVMTDNSKYGAEIEPYFKKGYPIFGCNQKAAELELDREVGQRVLEESGIECLPFETFTSYDKAAEYVRKTGKTYVCKPWGGNPDKSLSYVSKSPADMIYKLERWKTHNKMKGKFLLQECIQGVEMAVGGWFGPGGWCEPLNENWEEKRLMNEGLGVNTGEMGTVMRYTKKSALFDQVLKPCTDHLADLGYVGYVDMNCMVDDKGTPWPLEFTMRFGWPHFNLCMSLHKGDPANWMAGLLEGKDLLRVSEDVCVGVVIAHGDYPYGNFSQEEVSGFPLAGVKPAVAPRLHLSSVMKAEAPIMVGEKVETRETWCTAGEYIAIATGLGPTVCAAQEACYDLAWSIEFPSNRMFRTDIGCRLEDGLPELQKHGFAKGMKYE